MRDFDAVSERGYYYDLSLSPHKFVGNDLSEYVFPSPKKKEVFINEVNKRVSYLFYLIDRIHSISARELENVGELITAIEQDTYNTMKEKF